MYLSVVVFYTYRDAEETLDEVAEIHFVLLQILKRTGLDPQITR